MTNKTIAASDIPSEIMTPPNWDQWTATGYRGNPGSEVRTIVRASSREQAIELGKAALRTMGIRGKLTVSASPYYPWLDPEFHRSTYIRVIYRR